VVSIAIYCIENLQSCGSGCCGAEPSRAGCSWKLVVDGLGHKGEALYDFGADLGEQPIWPAINRTALSV